MPEMHRRTEPEADLPVAGHEPVRHMEQVVAVGEHDPLFEHRAVDVVTPPGKAIDEAELREIGVPVEFQPGLGLLGPQLYSSSVGQVELLR